MQLFAVFVLFWYLCGMAYTVTIGIPVYNAEKNLLQTMESALAQDFPSIEFLILDDCGTDGSMDIIRRLQQQHPRGKDIRIVRQDFNKGIGAARNRVLKEARGRFLYFLDADDLIIPTTISLMVSKARAFHAEVVMASYERVELYRQEPKRINYQHPDQVFLHGYDFPSYAFSRYGILQANIWNVLMDMQLIRESRLRFVNTNFWEDMAFKNELVNHVTRAVLLSDITYSYMCRVNTLSNFQDRKVIAKEEVFRNAATMDTLKFRYEKLLWRPYFSKWLDFVMDTDFYVVREALRQRDKIQPAVSDEELRNLLNVPLSVIRVLRFGSLKCWLYKLLSMLPPGLSMALIRQADKGNSTT